MNILDKAKVAAEKASTKAQQGVHQGQAKIEELQARRREDALLRALGVATYAEQRSGGDHEAVVRALAAVDAHHAARAEETRGEADPTPTTPNGSNEYFDTETEDTEDEE